MQIIYHYHPVTSLYLGQDVADESPLEPGIYLIPASSTVVPPPVDPAPRGYGHMWSEELSKWVTERLPVPDKGEEDTDEHLTEEELNAKKWKLLRENRNKLLSETDYLFMRDYILTPEQDFKWRTYRTALRDLPKNTTDIDNPPWPQPPY